MKRNFFITTAIFLITATSCIKEKISNNDYHNSTISITGAAMYNFSGENSRAESISSLENNDSIIFSSKGGIIADRDTLVYDGLNWYGLKAEKWEANKESADYCALHPILEEYNEASLYYDNNELRDVICCKSITEYGKGISLSFRHLFSKIQINIDDELNKTLDKIHITIPNSIEKIDILTGDITIKNETKEVVLERNDTSRYEIFVPACNNQTIPFKLTTTDGNTYNATISHSEYLSGYQYVCNVKYNNGIYTKEDFIAFSYLINGEEYNDRSLDEFYILKDGKMVFNLFADLHFTEEETILIKDFTSDEYEFDGIFEGNNHTISGIRFNADKDRRIYVSIFEKTTLNSIIRNLTLENVSIVENNESLRTCAAFLVGYNNGIIDNCHIKSGNIKVQSKKNISGICSVNYGYIINSSVDSLYVEKGEGLLSPICSSNHSMILNCSVNMNIDCNVSKTEYIGAICNGNRGTVDNIYTYGYLKNNYIINTLYKNSINKNIYFNSKFSVKIYNSNESNNFNYITHNDTPEDYITNVAQLNEWIDTEGKTQYPEIKFKRWVTDGTSAPRLE